MILPVDKWLKLGPQIMVQRREIHQQEGLQHQGLSGYWNKAVILHEGGGENEKRLLLVIYTSNSFIILDVIVLKRILK